MNDFTKKELEHIANGIVLLVGQQAVLKKPIKHLLSLSYTVQFLINNYCEHPSGTPCPDCLAVQCDKCGVHYEEECEHEWYGHAQGNTQVPFCKKCGEWA